MTTWSREKPTEPGEPVPMLLWCPECGERHIDAGEFATKPHHTHACQGCGMVWRPAIGATVGVEYLPGFKDEADPDPPKEPEPGAEQSEADGLREQLDHARKTIARLRAEVKRKTQDEFGVWTCEWCRKPYGDEVEPAGVDEEGCRMCLACHDERKVEPEPPADGPYRVRYEDDTHDSLRFVEDGRIHSGGTLRAVSACVPWNETTIDWSRARRLLPADDVAATLVDEASEFVYLSDMGSKRAYEAIKALAERIAGGSLPRMVRASDTLERLRERMWKLPESEHADTVEHEDGRGRTCYRLVRIEDVLGALADELESKGP